MRQVVVLSLMATSPMHRMAQNVVCETECQRLCLSPYLGQHLHAQGKSSPAKNLGSSFPACTLPLYITSIQDALGCVSDSDESMGLPGSAPPQVLSMSSSPPQVMTFPVEGR